MTRTAPNRSEFSTALVLSGGNALGAYQGGAYQALHEAGWLPDWVAGASAGSVNGALICGNVPDERVAKLEAFWQPAPFRAAAAPRVLDELRRTSAAAATMAMGQPGVFTPRALYGPAWNPFSNIEPSSLYDTMPLAGTLTQLTDFERLNDNAVRFSATAVDMETGEDVVFDTRTHTICVEHIRASSALLPAFPPVEIDGRLLGDAGISANLPLDMVLSEVDPRPLLCIAIDLLPLRGPRPATLGEATIRMQDLLFATQSRRALAAWQAIYDARVAAGERRAVMVLHIAYSDHRHEVSGKAFDFSAASAGLRWQAGHADTLKALCAIDAMPIADAPPGLHVISADESGVYRETKPQMAPQPG